MFIAEFGESDESGEQRGEREAASGSAREEDDRRNGQDYRSAAKGSSQACSKSQEEGGGSGDCRVQSKFQDSEILRLLRFFLFLLAVGMRWSERVIISE